MPYAALLLTISTYGIDYGWQPVAGGGVEYILQVEPETLELLKNGHDIVSDVPKHLTNIRTYRITSNRSPLPRINESASPYSLLMEPVSPSTRRESAAIPTAEAARLRSGPWLSSSPQLQAAPWSPVAPPSHADPLVQPAGGPPARLDGTRPADRPAQLPTVAEEAPRPWTPLVLTLLALFASIGANAYLVMLVASGRVRCRQLLAQLHTAG